MSQILVEKAQRSVKQSNYDNSSSKRLSDTGLSCVTINSTIYIYGGQSFGASISSVTAMQVMSEIPPAPFKLSHNASSNSSSIENNIPNLRYAPGVAFDDIILAFSGGDADNIINRSSPTTAVNDTRDTNQMTVYSFDLRLSQTWSAMSSNSSIIPLPRRDFTVSVNPSRDMVYMFGGYTDLLYSPITNAVTKFNSDDMMQQNDFWSYHVKSFLWERIASPDMNKTRCGHTASMLSNERIVMIGGYFCKKSLQKNSDSSNNYYVANLNLIPMDQVLVYDTKTAKWINDIPPPQGIVPRARTYHSAIVMDSNDNIFICGGQNEVTPPFQAYLGNQQQSGNLEDMAAILDTHTWTWRVPKASYESQPYPQSHALISMLNETKIALGYGFSYQTVHDHFWIFDTNSESWENSLLAVSRDGGNTLVDGSGTLASKINNTIVWVILGCIALTILLLYFVALWVIGFKRLYQKFFNYMILIKREIWKPRVGEPGWAEASRLVLKLVFLMLFVYLISTLTHQVIYSPIIDQLSYDNNLQMTVDVPDIKFCFDDWAEMPYIRCATDYGVQCSDYITRLQEADSICFLFSTPDSFKLGQTSGDRLQTNGSFLKFDYYYNTGSILNTSNKSGQIQVDVYNKLHDPEGSSLLEEQKSAERNDMNENRGYSYPTAAAGKGSKSDSKNNKNSYIVTFGKASTITYELVKRVSLNSNIWNYFGIASSVNTRHEIETFEASEFFTTMHDPSSGAPQPLGSLHVVTLQCKTKVLREQKAFAFINAMGIFGGLFGLLFSLQSCLFGHRPRSPWGYMHRWAFGHLKSSLMRGLQASFFPKGAAVFNEQSYGKKSDYPQQQHVSADDALSISMRTANPLLVDTTLITATPSYLIPISPSASPTSKGGGGKDEKEIRMALIEDRIHMLERLFQAYYIDDEIFRSLDYALKTDTSSSSSSDSSVLKSGRKRK